MPIFNALQPAHLLLILAIVLVVFGAGKLGQVGGALGQSIKEFKNNVSDPEEEARKEAEEARLAATAKAEPVKTTVVKTETVAKAEPVAAGARPVERETATLRREEI
jgi:sec-independent protein translocase protein TatA